MKYQVNQPVKFIDHFSFFGDSSSWNGEYKKTKNGCFPSFLGNFRETSLKNYKNISNLKVVMQNNTVIVAYI